MAFDINEYLRRFVLAGLPLFGAAAGAAACSQGQGPGQQVTPLTNVCSARTVYVAPNASPPGRTLNVGFAPDDPRWSDLFAACTKEDLHCGRLCNEILMASGNSTVALFNCELGCDAQGGAVATITFSTAVPGRRPEGFAGDVPTAPGTSLARYFRACAEMEGASVTAFLALADDLAGLGAPEHLISRARSAARDEVRHFSTMRRLARRYGGDAPAMPKPARPPRGRSLEAVAIENVTEGCVAETYAAVVALWQAQTATDPAVRAAMATVAADEGRHAALAWDVDAWARTELRDTASVDLSALRARAGEALARASAVTVDETLIREAGVPPATAAAFLAGSLQARVWSAA